MRIGKRLSFGGAHGVGARACATTRSAFRRVERDLDFGSREWHGTDGPVAIRRHSVLTSVQQAFLELCTALGQPRVDDHNAPNAVGAGPLPLNEVDSVRQSAVLTYRASAWDRPNLTVRSNAQVDQGVGFERPGDRRPGASWRGGLSRNGCAVRGRVRHAGSPVAVRRAASRSWREPARPPALRLRFAAPGGEVTEVQRQALLTTDDLQVFPSGLVADEAGPELTLLVALMRPESRGTFTLDGIDNGLSTDERDEPRLREGVELARTLAATPPLADLLDGLA